MKYRLITGPFVAMLLAAGFVAAVTRSRAAAAGAGIVMALITFFALLIMTPI